MTHTVCLNLQFVDYALFVLVSPFCQIDSLRSQRYCVIKVLTGKPRCKKGVGMRGSFAANSHSTGTAAPLPNLTRLVHNTASYAGYQIDRDFFVLLFQFTVNLRSIFGLQIFSLEFGIKSPLTVTIGSPWFSCFCRRVKQTLPWVPEVFSRVHRGASFRRPETDTF